MNITPILRSKDSESFVEPFLGHVTCERENSDSGLWLWRVRSSFHKIKCDGISVLPKLSSNLRQCLLKWKWLYTLPKSFFAVACLGILHIRFCGLDIHACRVWTEEYSDKCKTFANLMLVLVFFLNIVFYTFLKLLFDFFFVNFTSFIPIPLICLCILYL